MKHPKTFGDISAINENDGQPKSTLVSRNITVQGRRTSIRLEPEMWAALRDIAKRERCSIHEVCTLVCLRKKENSSLTAAIRVFLMLYYRAAASEEGHNRAGHGDFEHMKRRARIQPEEMSASRKLQKNGHKAYTPLAAETEGAKAIA